MNNPLVLITGATDGIGLATARGLVDRGARVLVHGRNPEKVERVSITLGTTGLCADLSSFEEVRSLAEQVKAVGKIDVLINNAGVFTDERRLTKDGHELTFGVNHLAHFLLTNLLMDSINQGGRVLNVSSIAHGNGKIHWGDLTLENHYSGHIAYSQSKLANVMFSCALARRGQKRGFTSNALHPGIISTKLLTEGFGLEGQGTDDGAATSIHLALSDEVEAITGGYFRNQQQTSYSDRADSEDAQERLWLLSEKITGLW